MENTGLRLLIVDDHPIVRDGFAAVLRDAGMQIVGMAGNGRDALALAAELLPDVILMDIHMPVMDGLRATQALAQQLPQIKVLMLTLEDSPEYAAKAMQAGAKGYMAKNNCDTDRLLHAIDTVQRGMFVSPYPPTTVSSSSPLTSRETEVLILVAKGKQSGEIARILKIETRTVETHRQNIRDKLGLRSVAELTRYALDHGLI
ncbi:MAG: response regulator transcription factor [Candidatus Thiothrix putei]|uniref:Two component transcriptional regulator, LuxR family n=2 Tax=Thiothrix TaxID=1030 RepID=A0A1H4G7E5_9GAMM|nr:response regulator transcription factor [Thiothrix caldifontis]WGZ95178.1 MAG: response regulator transcription factor [Candidatus Thiothrix putei]SEB04950.1 two component transcriptional regulator, LuxR family [Thiothrix caldifontis]